MTSSTLSEKLLQGSIPLIWLIVAISWFGYEMIWDTKVPFFRDLGPYFYPIRFSLAQSLSAGELPLWNRHMAMGFPLLADFQSATFYPPHLILLFLPFFDAIRMLFVFHYVIAATGSYALAVRWGYPPYLSLIAAFLFTFSGVIISLTNVLNHFQTAVWLPWLLLAGERAIRSYSGKDFLIFAAVAAVQFLAGSPEFYAMSLGLLCIGVITTAKQRGYSSYTKPYLLIIAANILMAAVAMVQLLPTIELFLQSRRPTSISLQEATSWSLHPLSIINFFVLDKEVDVSLFNGVRLFFGRGLPFLISLYIGQVSLFGICSWWVYARRRSKLLVVALVSLGLAIALGKHTLVYSLLLAYVPVFELFRFPEKFVFLVYPLLIVMTLQGLHAFVKASDVTYKKPLYVFGSILMIVIVVYLSCRLRPDYYLTLMASSDLVESVSIHEIFPSLLFSLERQILLAGAILLVVLLYKRERISVPVFRILILGLVLIDLVSVHRHYQFLVEPRLVTDKPKILSNSGSETYRLFSSLPNLHPSVFTFRERPYPEVTQSIWSSLVPNVGVFYGVDYMQEIDALGRAPYDFFLQAAKNLPPKKFYPLLGALNIKYISSFSLLPNGEIELLSHFPDYPMWMYQIEQPLPRVYVVPGTEYETDPVRTLERLASEDFDPLVTVLVDEPMTLSNTAGFQAEARILDYEHQLVNIQASLDSPGILVLADSFYPGWNAYVNGRKEKIYRANLFFRAVPLPAGTHTVEFRYEPRSFVIGRAVSIFTLSLIVAVSLLLSIRKRRQKLTASRC